MQVNVFLLILLTLLLLRYLLCILLASAVDSNLYFYGFFLYKIELTKLLLINT